MATVSVQTQDCQIVGLTKANVSLKDTEIISFHRNVHFIFIQRLDGGKWLENWPPTLLKTDLYLH